MNSMVLPPNAPSIQEFFTAAELAELAKRLGFAGFPHSERGVRKRAEADRWNELPPSRCRKRIGATGGGGFEYHIALVPRLESLLAAERSLQDGKIASHSVVAVRKLPACAAETSEGQRAVANARAEVLSAIRSYASRSGMKYSAAIKDFLLAQQGHEAWLTACRLRDTHEFLTHGHKLALAEGSPMTSLPPADRPTKRRTDDSRFPFGFGIGEALLAKANNRPRKGSAFQKVSRTTIYEWLKAYEEQGVSALAPTAPKQKEPIPADFWRFMNAYARPAKPKIKEVHRKYLETTPAGISPLSLNQVEYVLREKLDHVQKNKGREGRLALRARMAYVSRDTSDILPGTIYVGDGHTFDARIEDPSGSRAPMRPEITCIIDVASRRVVGFAISRKENVIAVTEALRNACVEHCVPAVVYFDNGAGYKNKRFDDPGNGLMARLDISKMHALPYGSQAKGNIERTHQSIWIPFARELPTYLGEDMDKEARMKVDKQVKLDRREFGFSKLLMPWNDFFAACQTRVEVYNERPHSELPRFEDPSSGRMRHMSPNEYWRSHVDRGFEPVLVDRFTSDDLFRPYEKRKVSRNLIELWTNEYFHDDLGPYHQQEVYVGYDYKQADRVWVREIEPVTHEMGKLICVAEFGGNKVSYMPKTYLQDALEKRERGRLKRNEQNRNVILDEQRSTLLLDHEAPEVASFIDLCPVSETSLETQKMIAVDSPTIQRRRTFESDEELAVWALENPQNVSPNQIAVLRRCISSPFGLENLRANGVDTEALRTLLRAAAA
ncbi:MAG: hypothetical protein DI498_10840 [Paracoccus denitrificans]|nr:MAG: hypothetical protein DI498_10840 [Paracoccus denitrificans]PZO83639.1 MAG: hypothetical protein DI633_10840 [Paracoccus denitrificans]